MNRSGSERPRETAVYHEMRRMMQRVGSRAGHVRQVADESGLVSVA